MNSMKRCCLTTALFCLVQVCWVGAQANPVGMVVRVQGTVTVQRHGQQLPVKPAQLLYEQDRLQVSGGTTTLVYCPTSERVTLSGRSLVVLGASELEVSGEAPQRGPLGRCALPQVSLDAASVERAGAVRVRESGLPAVALYLGGRIRSKNPLFRWQPVEGAQSYQLTVRKAAGEQIWQTSTSQSAVPMPAESTLADGFYEWQVDALQGQRIVATRSTRFEVRDDSGFDIPTEPLLAAVMLQSEGFYTEAAGMLTLLLENDPGDANLSDQIVWLYLQAGLKETADLYRRP